MWWSCHKKTHHSPVSPLTFLTPAFQLCFNCRKPGHGLADCPEAERDEEMGRGICYRCGSTEHEIQRCRAKVDPALGEDQAVDGWWVNAYWVVLLMRSCSFPSRWLSVRQVLHLWSDGTLVKVLPWQPQRTLRPRYTQTVIVSVYQFIVHPLKMFSVVPTGGCCRVCGSVEHFQKDCPEHQAAGKTLGLCCPQLSRRKYLHQSHVVLAISYDAHHLSEATAVFYHNDVRCFMPQLY